MKKLILFSLLGLLIFFAFIPRSVEVINKNYLFGFDQGRDYLAVKQIVVDHKLTLIGSEIGAGSAGFTGIFQGPGYYYLLAVPFILFNANPYGGEVLMFLLSLLSIFLAFLLAKRLFGIVFGAFSAVLVAMSPPLVSQARFIWNSHPTTPFILLTFYFVNKIKDGKNRYIFLSSFFAGFIYNFEIAVSVPICIAIVIYLLFIQKIRSLYSYLLLLLGYFLAFLPLFLFQARHKFLGIIGLIKYVTKKPVHEHVRQVASDHHFGSFLYNFYDSFIHLPQNYSTVFLIITILGLVVFLTHEKDSNLKRFMLFLVTIPPIALLVFWFLKTPVYDFYLVELNLVYIFIFSYLVKTSWNLGNKMPFVLYLIFFGAFVVIGFPLAYKTFKDDLKDYGGTAKIRGKEDAIDYIYKDVAGKPFSLLVFSPPVYTYPYDYILWWRGEKIYRYLPKAEKNGTFYLLIEVDGAKPWSYKGWLETVIKTGTIIKTVTLPKSGFIVQERQQL